MNVRWRSAELICEAFTYIAKIELNGLEAGPHFGGMERDVFIELPDEDVRKHLSDVVGRLRKSMYGLRDAPQIW